jgi:hypothetical protein
LMLSTLVTWTWVSLLSSRNQVITREKHDIVIGLLSQESRLISLNRRRDTAKHEPRLDNFSIRCRDSCSNSVLAGEWQVERYGL